MRLAGRSKIERTGSARPRLSSRCFVERASDDKEQIRELVGMRREVRARSVNGLGNRHVGVSKPIPWRTKKLSSSQHVTSILDPDCTAASMQHALLTPRRRTALGTRGDDLPSYVDSHVSYAAYQDLSPEAKARAEAAIAKTSHRYVFDASGRRCAAEVDALVRRAADGKQSWTEEHSAPS